MRWRIGAATSDGPRKRSPACTGRALTIDAALEVRDGKKTALPAVVDD